jgi:hypothetical protein
VELHALARPSLRRGGVDSLVGPSEWSLSVWSSCALSKLNRTLAFCEAEIKNEFRERFNSLSTLLFTGVASLENAIAPSMTGGHKRDLRSADD